MSPEQIRMARALLRLTTRDLADLASVDQMTVVNLEAGKNARASTIEKVKEALVSRGVVFLKPKKGYYGPGVAMRWGVEPPAVDQDWDETSG